MENAEKKLRKNHGKIKEQSEKKSLCKNNANLMRNAEKKLRKTHRKP